MAGSFSVTTHNYNTGKNEEKKFKHTINHESGARIAINNLNNAGQLEGKVSRDKFGGFGIPSLEIGGFKTWELRVGRGTQTIIEKENGDVVAFEKSKGFFGFGDKLTRFEGKKRSDGNVEWNAKG